MAVGRGLVQGRLRHAASSSTPVARRLPQVWVRHFILRDTFKGSVSIPLRQVGNHAHAMPASAVSLAWRSAAMPLPLPQPCSCRLIVVLLALLWRCHLAGAGAAAPARHVAAGRGAPGRAFGRGALGGQPGSEVQGCSNALQSRCCTEQPPCKLMCPAERAAAGPHYNGAELVQRASHVRPPLAMGCALAGSCGPHSL